MDEELIKPMKDPFKPAKLGIRWLRFYANIRLPLSIILAFLGIFQVFFALESGTQNPLLFLLLLGYVAFIALLIFTCLGLKARKWWGWNLNWWLLIIEVLVYPFIATVPAYNFSEYLFSAVVFGLVWFLPNAIYFSKRECLFSK